MYYNNKRLTLSVFWVLLGTALTVLSAKEVLDSQYSSMGTVFIVIGAMQVIRNIRYRKDPEYRERINTEFSDERNSFIRMKSWSWAGYIVVLVEGAGAVVAMILGERTVQLVLSYSVCLILCVYWIAYLVLSRKY
ncbi:MAG: hypothetical protein IJ573_04425 [Clostridia bacterium]|nr:hypothetical protein [Clostridia bacterium]